MIVGTFFKCDDDAETAWKQHDVYGEALGAIIRTSNRLALFAKSLLDDKSHPNWGTIETCDHRTLQGAHDLLAAAWRFRHNFRQSELPLERSPELLVPHTPENLWLWWLRDEIEKWVWRPELVRDVQLILANQNQPVGYAAESRLCLALLDRFHDVPWNPEWRDTYESDLAKDLAGSVGTRQDAQPNPKDAAMPQANARPTSDPPVT
nr:hypothetical protein [uncultured Rhodopila sp.]